MGKNYLISYNYIFPLMDEMMHADHAKILAIMSICYY
jgi:hypothetical protein